METNTATLTELFTMVLFLGSVIFLLGIVYQIIIVVLNRSIYRTFGRIAILLLITRLASIVTSLLLWRFWFFDFDVMLGPILIPVLISEIILSPLFLRIFGFKIFINK